MSRMAVQRVKPHLNESALDDSALREGLLNKSGVVYEVAVASNVTFTVICYLTPCNLLNGPRLRGVTIIIYVKVIRDQIHSPHHSNIRST